MSNSHPVVFQLVGNIFHLSTTKPHFQLRLQFLKITIKKVKVAYLLLKESPSMNSKYQTLLFYKIKIYKIAI